MNELFSGQNIVLLTAALFALIIVIKGFRVVSQANVAIVERLGRFYKVLNPGVHIIIPLVDSLKSFNSRKGYTTRIDLREQVLDIPPQGVISKDNVNLNVDALVYYQITEPRKAMYSVENLTLAIEKLTQTTLRSVIGELELDQTLASRDTINSKLQIVLDEASDPWGAKITRVELSTVDPPKDIKVAMEKELRAERDRRAVVLEAEGEKRSAILKAEGERDALIAEAQGDKQAQIARAEGEAQATILKAEAEATAVNTVNSAMQESSNATDYFLSEKYIAAIESAAMNGKQTFMFPMELTGLVDKLSRFTKK